MGKRGRGFSLVKRALSCESREKKNKKSQKSRSWFGKKRSRDSDSSVHSPVENVKLMEAENAQNRHAYSVAFATAVAAEAAVAAAEAAAEVVRLTAAPRTLGKTNADKACITIQTSFRRYLARKTLRSVRGLARLKSLIEGHSVKRHQMASALKCMQTMTRIQFEICERRIRTSEDNTAIQRQIQRKHEKELEKLRASIGEDWDDSMQSKEQIEANFQSRQEAEIRRERALAYAYSHQQTWRSSSNYVNRKFMDPNNPHWSWSWLAQWIAARHCENGNAVEKGLNSDRVVVKDATKVSPMAQKQSRTPGRGSPSTTISKTAKKVRSPSSRGTIGTFNDSKSINTIQSEQCQRHSIACSSVRDNESFASSPAAPSYMATTVSAKAKSQQRSPFRAEKIRTPEKELIVSAKKRLSFSGSPAGSRSILIHQR